jgi:hypothetical protein
MSDGKEFHVEDASIYFGSQENVPAIFKNPFEGMAKLWISGDGAEHIWGKVVTLLHFGSEGNTKMYGGVFELLNHPFDERYQYGDWVVCDYVEHEGQDRLEGFIAFAKLPESWKRLFNDYVAQFKD